MFKMWLLKALFFAVIQGKVLHINEQLSLEEIVTPQLPSVLLTIDTFATDHLIYSKVYELASRFYIDQNKI